VIDELGYRDEFDWRIAGKVSHLGQPAFDAVVRRQIDRYIHVLGSGNTKVLFLAVPWSNPPASSNGSPAPAASSVRHALIDSMLRAAVRQHRGRADYLDIDKVISPGDRYRARVDGKLCRFDGVHLTIYYSQLLQRSI
jgi:hypothetical protein